MVERALSDLETGEMGKEQQELERSTSCNIVLST
jgi:hypothetical protein